MPAIHPIAIAIADLHLTLTRPACRTDIGRSAIKRHREWMEAISNLGNGYKIVKHFPRYKIGKNGELWSFRHNRHDFSFWRRVNGIKTKTGHI